MLVAICAGRSRTVRNLSRSLQRLNEWDDAAQKESKKSSWFNRAKPDPTRPRYEDPGQNFFKPYKEFREEKRQQLLSGDNKRKVPLKALVPEEYRGARYYTDAHMEVVDPKNVKPKVFMGPYSIVLPHRDGRMEHPGDRVLCNQAIKDSLEFQAPLKLPEGFQDTSRYALKKNYKINPYRREIHRHRAMKLAFFTGLVIVAYRFIYCPYMGIPDPVQNDVDKFVFMAPVLVGVFMIANVGGTLTSSLLSLYYRMRFRL